MQGGHVAAQQLRYHPAFDPPGKIRTRQGRGGEKELRGVKGFVLHFGQRPPSPGASQIPYFPEYWKPPVLYEGDLFETLPAPDFLQARKQRGGIFRRLSGLGGQA